MGSHFNLRSELESMGGWMRPVIDSYIDSSINVPIDIY